MKTKRNYINITTITLLAFLQIALTGCYENQYTDLSALSFKEDSLNQGTIENHIDFSMSEYYFNEKHGDVPQHRYRIHGENLPEGLNFHMEYINRSKVRMTLVGQSTNHAKTDSATIVVELRNSMFHEDSDIPYNRVFTLTVDFYDEFVEFSDTEFFEDAEQDIGLVLGNAHIDLNQKLFLESGELDPSLYTVENLPLGLEASVMVSNDKKSASIMFNGISVNHDDSDDVSNIIFLLSSDAIEDFDQEIESVTLSIDYQ